MHSTLKLLAAVPLLSAVVVQREIAPATHAHADPVESVARALISAPDSLPCFVLPDTLHPETTGKAPFKVCGVPGVSILRDRRENIVSLEIHYREGTQQYAEHTLDSIVGILRPILGEARHCRRSPSLGWKGSGYQASIVIRPSSDVVRPDNQWGANFEIELSKKRAWCDPL